VGDPIPLLTILASRKTMLRRIISTLLAVGAMAVAALAASSAALPASAHAASCMSYGMPTYSEIQQANGWTLWLWKGGPNWYAYAYSGRYSMNSAYVYMGTYGGNPAQPCFKINWTNGAVGR
jgi:hypothetical protein